MKHARRSITMIATLALASGALATAPGASGARTTTLSGEGFTLSGHAQTRPSEVVLQADGLTLTGSFSVRALSADVAQPFGVLDTQDKAAFMSLMGAQDPRADLAEPKGVIDAADLSEFVRRYETNQPEG